MELIINEQIDVRFNKITITPNKIRVKRRQNITEGEFERIKCFAQKMGDYVINDLYKENNKFPTLRGFITFSPIFDTLETYLHLKRRNPNKRYYVQETPFLVREIKEVKREENEL
jgi:hypothetical protein